MSCCCNYVVCDISGHILDLNGVSFAPGIFKGT